MLELKNISKVFKYKNGDITEVLRDVSCTIRDGECVAIIGPSGSGKTTLLRAVAGLNTLTHGEIKLHGKKLVSASREQGMVFQHFSLFPWLSLKENIAFGLRLKNLSEEEIERIVERYLVITGLTQHKNAYPRSLSGGMQQRAAIARTLANDPKLFLLDEPFAALDVQTRAQMQDFLSRIIEEEKKTTIIVTHDVEEALYLADRIIILSTKPAMVKEIVTVPFARPRRSEIRFHADFIQLKKYLTYAIRSESIKASTDVQSIPSEKDMLVVGSNIWTGVAPFYLAKEKLLFEKRGLRAEIATLEWSDDRLLPWREGRVDALDTPLDSALVEYSKDPDLRIFMALDLSAGGDAIIANGDCARVQDLKGKRIGVEKNWVSHFFLCYVLHKVGLSSKDVILKDMKASDIGSQIISGGIDAGSVQEPWLSKAKEFTETNAIATSKDYPVIFAVLIAKKQVIEEKREAFKKLRMGWEDAIRLMKNDTAEAIRIMAPYLGLPEVELAQQLSGLRFVDPKIDLTRVMQDVQEVLLKEGFITAPLDLKKITDF